MTQDEINNDQEENKDPLESAPSPEDMKRMVEERDTNKPNPVPPINKVGEIPKIDGDPYLESAEKMKKITGDEGLGKVESKRHSAPDQHQLDKVKEISGYLDLTLANFPSGGRFYEAGTKVLIRSAKVREIRDFSTIDETNLFDVDDKLNNILVSCCKVQLPGRPGSYKDLLEEDRIFVILSIRELTFVQGESKLQLKSVCKQCDTENMYELRTNTLQYNDPEEDIEKYFNSDQHSFIFRTKSSGEIKMSPPTIGVMQSVTRKIRDKEQRGEKWDKSFYQVLPYIQGEWRGFTDEAMMDIEVKFQGWSIQKYSTVFNLADKIKVGVKQQMSQDCSHCSAEVTVPVAFPGGIKSIFLIQDPAEELL